MNMRDGVPAALQGRELQEAAPASIQIGGMRHAIGCRSLTSAAFILFEPDFVFIAGFDLARVVALVSCHLSRTEPFVGVLITPAA